MKSDVEDLSVNNDNVLYSLLDNDSKIVWKSYQDGNPLSDNSTMDFMITLMKKSMSSMICNMGYSLLAINSKGDIYPCQTLLNKQELIIGNVYYTEIENHTLFLKYKEISKGLNKNENERCECCIAINFCQGCPARWYIDRNTLEPWNLFCESIRKQTKEMLLNIAQLQRNPETWKKFSTSWEKLRDEINYLRS